MSLSFDLFTANRSLSSSGGYAAWDKGIIW